MTDSIKERARAFIEEAWSKGNLAIVDEMLAPDYVNHSPLESDQPAGREGYKRAIVTLRTGFPDLTSTVEEVLVEGDRVVTRYTARGTHVGTFQGVAPTGKRIEASGTTIDRYAGGRIVETWDSFDLLAVYRQIGVFSGPGA